MISGLPSVKLPTRMFINSWWVDLDRFASRVFLTLEKDPWIRKIGFPVLTVAEEPGQISVRQNRFLSTGDAKPEEDETTWWIPLGIKSGPRLADVDSRALVSKSDTIAGVGQDSFYKINKNLSGFYRTNYPAARLAKLGQSLDLLSTEDKIGLIGDAAALAVSGEGTSAALLALLEGFKGEENYLLVPNTPLRDFELVLTAFMQGLVTDLIVRRKSALCLFAE
jgi:hypothetical protein